MPIGVALINISIFGAMSFISSYEMEFKLGSLEAICTVLCSSNKYSIVFELPPLPKIKKFLLLIFV